MPIESVAVYNRTEGNLGRRLEGFTLVVLDDDRKEVFRQDGSRRRARARRSQVGEADPAVAICAMRPCWP